MIPRILEPEVMNTPEEAIGYDNMNHHAVNTRFVDDLFMTAENFGLPCFSNETSTSQRILDVGTGTAQIPVEFCRRGGNAMIVAIDLAEEMLKVARQNVSAADCSERIQLKLVDSKQLPDADNSFDVVISNSIVHHIPEPQTAIAEMLRVLKSGGLLFVRDLLRPNSTEELDSLVSTYAKDENPHQQRMFAESLHAALTLPELHEILKNLDCPLTWATQTTDRHWTIEGVMS